MTESGVKQVRKSIPYYAPGSRNDYSGTHEWMFVMDTAEYLFPIGGDVGRQAVFRLLSGDEGVSRLVTSAFASFDHGGYADALSSVLAEFGNRAVHDLLCQGCDTYEVAPTVDATDSVIGFSVVPVEGARSVAGFTWQTVPRDALVRMPGQEPERVKRRVVRIPRGCAVRMRLPLQYRRVPRGLRALRHIGSAVPDFAIRNLESDGSGAVPYDLEEMKQIEHRAVALITRSTGWDGRSTFRDSATGYYTMKRFLRFEAFKARLRSTVADTINRILAISGAVVGFEAVVKLHHVPTLEEVRSSCEDLAAGRFDFLEAIDQYSVYRRRPDPPTPEA